MAVLLYSAQHWIGVDEPKARFSAPVAGSLADRAGLRSGDWVQAYSLDGAQWQDVRSMTDLRWEVTQAVLRGERLHLMVTDGEGRGQRAECSSSTPGRKGHRRQLMRRHGWARHKAGDNAVMAG